MTKKLAAIIWDPMAPTVMGLFVCNCRFDELFSARTPVQ